MLNPMRDQNESSYRGREGRPVTTAYKEGRAGGKTSYELNWSVQEMIQTYTGSLYYMRQGC